MEHEKVKPSLPEPCDFYKTKYELINVLKDNLMNNHNTIKKISNKELVSLELATDIIMNEKFLKIMYLCGWEFEWYILEKCAMDFYLLAKGLNTPIETDMESNNQFAKYITENEKINSTFIFMKNHICGFYKQCNLSSVILYKICNNQFNTLNLDRVSIWYFVKRLAKVLDITDIDNKNHITNQDKFSKYLDMDLKNYPLPKDFTTYICNNDGFVKSIYTLIRFYKSDYEIVGI